LSYYYIFLVLISWDAFKFLLFFFLKKKKEKEKHFPKFYAIFILIFMTFLSRAYPYSSSITAFLLFIFFKRFFSLALSHKMTSYSFVTSWIKNIFFCLMILWKTVGIIHREREMREIQLRGTNSKQLKSLRDIGTLMFMPILFTIAKVWKQSKCTLTNKW
jgi:hypothetical protein